jgi:SAM-dependent methyltransferase
MMALEYGRLMVAGRGMSGEERTVRAAYRAMLRREPDASELAEATAQLRDGSMRVGGLASRLIVSAEFQRRFAAPAPAPEDSVAERAYAQVLVGLGPDATDEQFLHTAYQTLLRRLPDVAGRDAALQGLRSGTVTRRAVVVGMVTSPEYGRVQASAPSTTDAQLYQQVLAELGPDATDEQFLRAAYQITLKRPADSNGVAHFTRLLQRGATTRPEVIQSIMASAEYRRVIGQIVEPMSALHQMRMLLFQNHIPQARRVLDLGGAAHNHDEGALLLMGYPYRPEEIQIIDLPPDARIGGAEAAENQREVVTSDGIRIRYLYRSMADLADIPDASIDLIVSGESIEHISEADGLVVCREAFRILAPGGSFCLDTPNAALTRLQMPDEFIHPEHQKEYLVQEIRDMLTRYGFTLAAQKAVCPMPESLRTGTFDIDEMSRNMGISDQPEEGYVFFIHAVKPV